MLLREAQWLARRMEELGAAALYPMVNLGSQTEEFRARTQPWIDHYLFAPARRHGRKVIHVDLQDAPGVDLVGDLTEPAFLQQLRQLRVRSVLCNNLLEHVTNRERIAGAILDLLPPGGYVFLTVPLHFPYHPNPIDTMFRPRIAELAELFPGTRLTRAAELDCGTLFHYVLARAWYTPVDVLKETLATVRQELAPGHIRRESASTAQANGQAHGPHSQAEMFLRWLFRTVTTTCLILQKNDAPGEAKADE